MPYTLRTLKETLAKIPDDTPMAVIGSSDEGITGITFIELVETKTTNVMTGEGIQNNLLKIYVE